MESAELRIFLTKVFTNDAEALRIKASAESSRQELAKITFSDWVSLEVVCYQAPVNGLWSCISSLAVQRKKKNIHKVSLSRRI